MGLSFSLLLSPWDEILRHRFFNSINIVDKAILRSMSLEKEETEVDFRTKRFKEEESDSINMFDGLDDVVVKREGSNSISLSDKARETIHITKPTIRLPDPVIMFSPRPVNELYAAAIKLQKVYKSYRTRRNLADCAVVVEELWWKALDSAAVKRCSISFNDLEKQETAISRWSRARKRAVKVGKGLSKDEKAQKLALQHWLEAIDPRHRYGHNLHFYYDIWSESGSTQPFFYWLDVGDGKELNLEKCPRINLQRQCILYLGPKEREACEVIVESGRLVYKQTGNLLNTVDGSKWIFVLSPSRALYVGQKKKGVFQHSSFLSGGAATAAGRLVAHKGVLKAIWPCSGYYLPTEDNFKEFIAFLAGYNVDLTNVKRCSIDDDLEVMHSTNVKITFERIIVVINFILEIPSAVLDQLSSVHKPLYAFVVMMLSLTALLLCIIELVHHYQGRKKKLTWGWRGMVPWLYYLSPANNDRKPFYCNIHVIVGFTCSVCQSILTTINYILLVQHTNSQIQISVWPIIFAFVLLCSKFLDSTKNSTRERRAGQEV